MSPSVCHLLLIKKALTLKKAGSQQVAATWLLPFQLAKKIRIRWNFVRDSKLLGQFGIT